MATIALRGVFAREDAWLATTDLFRRDADGDYWRLDSVRELIPTAAGPVFTAPIRDALGDLPSIDLAVAYGVPDGRGRELAVAAVTLAPGQPLSAPELTAALRALPRARRPTLVRVVERIPLTTWFRPITSSLREEGIAEPGAGLPVFYRGPRADTYRPYTVADHERLLGGAQDASVSPE
jgi:putative long chain acyl-CoA synthase